MIYINGVKYEVHTPKWQIQYRQGEPPRIDGGQMKVVPCKIPGHVTEDRDCGHPTIEPDYCHSIEEAIERGWVTKA